MKKLVVAIGVLLGVGFTTVNAQTTFTFGAKAGANVSNYILKDMPSGVSSSMNVGADLGGFVNMNFGGWFSLQPELKVTYRNSKLKLSSNAAKESMEYWGMEIPIYAMGQIDLGTGKGYIGIGPYVGLGFSNKNTTADIDMYDTDAMGSWDFGGAALVGYEFRNGIQINATYQMGFINLVDEMAGDPKIRTQAVSLGVGYRF